MEGWREKVSEGWREKVSEEWRDMGGCQPGLLPFYKAEGKRKSSSPCFILRGTPLRILYFLITSQPQLRELDVLLCCCRLRQPHDAVQSSLKLKESSLPHPGKAGITATNSPAQMKLILFHLTGGKTEALSRTARTGENSDVSSGHLSCLISVSVSVMCGY